MTLIKTSILSAIATIIKIFTGFISIKVVAVYIGPAGLALLGQIQNFIAMMSTIASAGVSNGVVKYTSEHYADNAIKQKVWSSALKISILLIIPMAVLIIVLSDSISMKLLHTTEYSSIFKVFAVLVVFFVLNGLLTSILNGQKEIKKLTILNIIGSFFSLVVTVVLVMKYQLYGALVAGIVTQSIVFFVTLSFVVKSSWFKISMFFGKIDIGYRNKLLNYSIMAVTSAIVIPLSQIYIRNYIGDSIGWSEAGYWQAIWRISETYLMFITVTLSTYYLPKLSSIYEKKELKKELLYGYKIIMPIVIILALGIYFLRDYIIYILFTDSFLPMKELFFYQLIGDVFKIASWLLAMIMVAKAMTKLYIITEVIFTVLTVFMSMYFIDNYGVVGVTISFMLSSLMYFFVMIILMNRYLRKI